MKNKIKLLGVILLCSGLLSSCYTYKNVVGEGAKGNQEVTKWNHYVLYGLAPVSITDSEVMADGAMNYTVTTRQTFLNGLLLGVTLGIYTPTTTTVKK